MKPNTQLVEYLTSCWILTPTYLMIVCLLIVACLIADHEHGWFWVSRAERFCTVAAVTPNSKNCGYRHLSLSFLCHRWAMAVSKSQHNHGICSAHKHQLLVARSQPSKVLDAMLPFACGNSWRGVLSKADSKPTLISECVIGICCNRASLPFSTFFIGVLKNAQWIQPTYIHVNGTDEPTCRLTTFQLSTKSSHISGLIMTY